MRSADDTKPGEWEQYIQVDYDTRTVFFDGSFTIKSSNKLKSIFDKFNSSEEEVTLHMDSDGGDLRAVFSLIQFLESRKFRLTVKVTGCCFSAAPLILMCADKRIAHKDTMFMLHEGNILGSFSTRNELDTFVVYNTIMTKQLFDYLDKKTSSFSGCWHGRLTNREDYYFDAIEAKMGGFIDEIS